MAFKRFLSATAAWGFGSHLQDKGKASDVSASSSSSKFDEQVARRAPLLAMDSQASVLRHGSASQWSYGTIERRSVGESSRGASSRNQSPEAYRRSGSLP